MMSAHCFYDDAFAGLSRSTLLSDEMKRAYLCDTIVGTIMIALAQIHG